MPLQPRPDDMWSRWSFAADAPAQANVVVEEPWWERHNIPLPNTIFKLQDIAAVDAEDGVWRIK